FAGDGIWLISLPFRSNQASWTSDCCPWSLSETVRYARIPLFETENSKRTFSAIGTGSPEIVIRLASKGCASSVRSREYRRYPGDAYTAIEFTSDATFDSVIRRLVSLESRDPISTAASCEAPPKP